MLLPFFRFINPVLWWMRILWDMHSWEKLPGVISLHVRVRVDHFCKGNDRYQPYKCSIWIDIAILDLLGKIWLLTKAISTLMFILKIAITEIRFPLVRQKRRSFNDRFGDVSFWPRKFKTWSITDIQTTSNVQRVQRVWPTPFLLRPLHLLHQSTRGRRAITNASPFLLYKDHKHLLMDPRQSTRLRGPLLSS